MGRGQSLLSNRLGISRQVVSNYILHQLFFGVFVLLSLLVISLIIIMNTSHFISKGFLNCSCFNPNVLPFSSCLHHITGVRCVGQWASGCVVLSCCLALSHDRRQACKKECLQCVEDMRKEIQAFQTKFRKSKLLNFVDMVITIMYY